MTTPTLMIIFVSEWALPSLQTWPLFTSGHTSASPHTSLKVTTNMSNSWVDAHCCLFVSCLSLSSDRATTVLLILTYRNGVDHAFPWAVLCPVSIQPHCQTLSKPFPFLHSTNLLPPLHVFFPTFFPPFSPLTSLLPPPPSLPWYMELRR